jgi:hypothetical protein
MKCPGDYKQLPIQRLANPVTRTLKQSEKVFDYLTGEGFYIFMDLGFFLLSNSVRITTLVSFTSK